jgi:hypothetical protein
MMKILRNKKFKISELTTRARNSIKKLGLSSENEVHDLIESLLNDRQDYYEIGFYETFRGHKTSIEIVEEATGFGPHILYTLRTLERMGYSGAIRTPKKFDGDEFVAFINVLE